MSDPRPDLDPTLLRRAFGAFPTGVTVTATRAADGAPVGFTANSFASVSLDPPLLLVCMAFSASGLPHFRVAESFAVSVLSADQRDVSNTFARPGVDRFSAASWRSAGSGAPVIEGAAAWFDCAVARRIEAGDHLVLIGRVLDFADALAAPLGYHRGGYVEFGGDAEAVGVAAPGLTLGALIERPDGALLLREEGDALRLPSAARFGPENDPASLLGVLRAGADVGAPAFVYASFDIGSAHWIVYRGDAPAGARAGAGWRFGAPDDATLSRMPEGEAALLARYAAERAAPVIGLYRGDVGRI